ncbi:TPA: hypothetical protein JBH14_09550 [Legionella pneumophila]|nr:hypothetical protein [Legionella pneumophila]HAU0871246.1 hypothetical protein [Legionella pneumophila]
MDEIRNVVDMKGDFYYACVKAHRYNDCSFFLAAWLLYAEFSLTFFNP